MPGIECGPAPKKGWMLAARIFEGTDDLMLFPLFTGDLFLALVKDKPVSVDRLPVCVTCSCHEGSREAEIRSYLKKWRKGEPPIGSTSYYAIALKPGSGVQGPSLQKYLAEHNDVKFEVL